MAESIDKKVARPAKPPRKHHFLPRFYLGGFTVSGHNDGELHVVDRRDGRRWKGTPASVAYERDFYRVDDVPTVAPDAIEELLARVESDLAPTVATIAEQRRLPAHGSREFWRLLNLVAGLITRVPQPRRVIGDFYEATLKKALRLQFETPERYQSVVEALKAAGRPAPQVSYEEMKRFGEEDRYRVEIPRTLQVRAMFESIDVLLPLLARRHWALLIAEEGQDFIVSDNPVAVRWTTPQPPSIYRPAFGLKKTDVTMPLTRWLALLGRFERLPAELSVSRQQVAAVNYRTVIAADRFIAAPGADFPWPRRDGSVGGVDDLVTLLKAAHRRSSRASRKRARQGRSG